jgi:hypothetical protein
MLLTIGRFFLKIALFFVSFIIQVGGYNGFLQSVPVNIGWSVVINITNMFFVVVLLIIAFATILGLEQYEWKKLLPKLFFAAVLINFSRTICGLLIDLSQVLMMTFVNAVAASAGALVINGFGLDKLEKFNQTLQPSDLVATGIFVSAIAAVVFAALIMTVFGAYLLILIGRLIRLWILIILSPLAFALEALPTTAGYAGSWWSELADNLVTGPVLMFFMWLSLAVVGSGNLGNHVSQYSNTPADSKFAQEVVDTTDPKAQISADDRQRAQSAGLTDILVWGNLANFIIAICLLFAGAEVASKIGGSSGNLMGAALSFGKKVATIATGAAVGRWAYDHISGAATSAPGFIADKLIMNPLRRRAVAIGGALSLMRGKIEEWQSAQAVALEKKGTLGKIGAWFIESSGRKMKKAEDWQDAAKYQAKIVEETYSTSSLTAGQIKLDTAQRAQMVEHTAAAAKELKFAQQETKMEHVAEEIDTTQKNLEAAKNYEEKDGKLKEARKELAEANISNDPKQMADAQERFNQAEKDFNAAQKAVPKDKDGNIISSQKMALKMGDFKDVNVYYAQRRSKMLKSKAEAEELKKRNHDDEALAVAAARDEYLISKRGVDGGYLDQARAAQTEEAVKRAGVASYDKSMAKVALINEKILEATKQIEEDDKKIANKDLSAGLRKEAQSSKEKNKSLIENLQKEQNNLMLANISRGALFGVSGEQRALESGGRNIHKVGAELSNENLMAAQANFLASKLGRDVDATHEGENGIAKALADLEGKMGGAYVEQVANALNDMAEQGASHYAGLFKGEMVEGKFKIRATEMERDGQYVEGKREWAISQSKVGKIHGFDASVDNDVVQGAGGKKEIKVRIESKTALDNVGKIFASLTANNLGNVDQNNIDTLARAMKNAHDGEEVKKILDTIRDASAAGEGQIQTVMNALISRIKNSTAFREVPEANANAVKYVARPRTDIPPPIPSEGSGSGSSGGGSSTPPPATPPPASAPPSSPPPKPPKPPRDTTSRPKRG